MSYGKFSSWFRALFSVPIIAILGLVSAPLANASTEPPQLDEQVVANKVIRLAHERGYSITDISDISITTSTDDNPDLSSDVLAKDIADTFFPATPQSYLPQDGDTTYTSRSTNSYTARVFSGVPLLGACNIYQDLTATVSNHKVVSSNLLGNSYVGGVCIFAWSPNRSWTDQAGGTFNVYMKGTASAIVKGSSVSFNPTFKAIFDIQQNNLRQHTQ